MKILVTGSSGQLGYDVVRVLEGKGFDVLAPKRAEMDITDGESVDSYFYEHLPNAVIHCAAYTAVDAAEDETELCRAVNVGGTANIADNCSKYDIPMVYISTDYVFNGTGDGPWKVGDGTDPINAYGLSKRDGESVVLRLAKHFIVRTSWVFGVHGKNFAATMLRLSQTRDTVRVVDDQYGSPTYTADLAELLADMVVTDKYGVYHAHNESYCTWADFAEEIFRQSGLPTKVERITTAEYPLKARRPLNSRMDTSSLTDAGFKLLPDWKDALSRYLDAVKRS